jgi:hypothetical protein
VEANPKAKLVDFVDAMATPESQVQSHQQYLGRGTRSRMLWIGALTFARVSSQADMDTLKAKVMLFCASFPTVGFDADDMKYALTATISTGTEEDTAYTQ